MAFEVINLKDRIGSEIRTDKATLLSGERAKDIRDLLEQRGVIAFREIDMSDDEQIAFTHTLGTFAHEWSEQKAGAEGKDAVYPITMDPTINPVADYLKGAFFWHIDGTMAQTPILASIMSGRRLSAPGTGQTEFCNTYAAWDELPAAEKAEIEHLKVVHSMWRSQLYWHPEPSYALLQQWKSRGANELPLVWKHRSGRQSLVLGCTAMQVVGMDWPESEDLLIRLRDWATQDRFVYRHEWSLGDMVVWDNTGTMHRAMPYDHQAGRLMHRTKLEGEEAFA
ncbi:MAG: TauD/TfdA family dioxygenase [Sphingomonadales bacterium]|nr:TauD/TfdA family dioxygenase [Sphingomonadales bacterium]